MDSEKLIIDDKKDFLIISYDFILNDKPTAGFDLDNTIIKTKSGKKFPIDMNDWCYLYKNTLHVLKNLVNTHNIVIFTNQSTLKKQEKKLIFIEKIKNIISDLLLPIKIYISIENGYFRKPLTGLWKNHNSYNQDDFFCGDAAGRKDDFSDTDLLYALNLNIKFLTPEELFLEQKVEIQYNMPDILTRYIGKNENIILPKLDKLLILMCGYPGSGKSYLSKLINIPIVSNDIQGNKSKCKKKLIEYLKKDNKIIIDNTNHTLENRTEYINIAKNYEYHTVIIYINNDINFCYYMNQYRCEKSKGNKKLISKIAYYTLRKNFAIPVKEECDTFIDYTNKVDKSLFEYKFPLL